MQIKLVILTICASLVAVGFAAPSPQAEINASGSSSAGTSGSAGESTGEGGEGAESGASGGTSGSEGAGEGAGEGADVGADVGALGSESADGQDSSEQMAVLQDFINHFGN